MMNLIILHTMRIWDTQGISPHDHPCFTRVCKQLLSAHWVWFPENTAGWGCCLCAFKRSSTHLQCSLSPHAAICMHARTGIARNSHISTPLIWDLQFSTIQTLWAEPAAPSASLCFQWKNKLLSLGIRNLLRDMQVLLSDHASEKLLAHKWVKTFNSTVNMNRTSRRNSSSPHCLYFSLSDSIPTQIQSNGNKL